MKFHEFNALSLALTASVSVAFASAVLADDEDNAPHLVLADSNGQLVFAFEGFGGTIDVSPQVTGLNYNLIFSGYVSDPITEFPPVVDLGFEAADQVEINELIGEGLLPVGSVALSNSTPISLVGVTLEDDIAVTDQVGGFIGTGGQSFSIGNAAAGIDFHPLWIFELPDLGPNPPFDTTIGTFRLTGGGLADSATFDVTLVVPEPATLGLLAIGGVLALARRRRATV